ncbi:APH(3') family aminoglycoside O-phosphotransferase [Flavobacterium sp. ZB4R12]|uniref:APH(3') family aminoglycoside O-phosphotransferase n=1 Tax=Flavobacterium sp. ZB4R12 TaxID=3398732 RepID=UPI003AAF5EFE
MEETNLPKEINIILKNYSLTKIILYKNQPSIVYKATKNNSYPTYFLKIDSSLKPEKDRLIWLQEKLNVPKVIAFFQNGNKDYLLLSEIPGENLIDTNLKLDPNSIIKIYANGLKIIHNLSRTKCPFDSTTDVLIKKAEKIITNNQLDHSALSSEYKLKSFKELLDELSSLQPTVEDNVFIHGDYSMPNIITNKKEIGFVDFGLAGIGDRYVDLSIASRSIKYNLGEEWVSPFFESYGIVPNKNKLRFFLLLDQFVMMRSSIKK